MSVERTEIGQLGEFGLIDQLAQRVNNVNSTTQLGIGDDAAVINSDGGLSTLVSSEIFTEGIHFELIYHPLKHLGYKLVVATISDLVAMNTKPSQLLVSMALSSKFSVEAVDEFYTGILKACEMYKIDLIGGDTASSRSGIAFSLTAIGYNSAENIIYRSGANKGDLICVSGDLGASYLGLQILEREKQLYLDNPQIQPELDDQAYLIERQLKPEARVDMLDYFDNAGFKPTSLIDISDGLASDLMQICKKSEVGAFIEEGQIPMHNDTKMKALDFKLDPVTCALNGGEDFELLFTANPNDLEIIKYLPDTYIIGEVTDKNDGINLHTTGGNIHALQAPGWPKSHKAQ